MVLGLFLFVSRTLHGTNPPFKRHKYPPRNSELTITTLAITQTLTPPLSNVKLLAKKGNSITIFGYLLFELVENPFSTRFARSKDINVISDRNRRPAKCGSRFCLNFMYFCYILKSIINSKYYIGSTTNLQQRLKLHNAKRVKSTARFAPWQIIHFEKFQTLSEARKRETQIKQWKSRAAIERLINNKI